MKNTSSMTEIKQLNASQEELDAWSLNINVDTVTPGFRTLSDWLKIWNKSSSAVREKLHNLVDEGHMKTQNFRVKTDSGQIRNVPHWKLVRK